MGFSSEDPVGQSQRLSGEGIAVRSQMILGGLGEGSGSVGLGGDPPDEAALAWGEAVGDGEVGDVGPDVPGGGDRT